MIPYISYNSPVTVIDTGGFKLVAIDANGVYHYADAIIVTVSLGVLKAEIIDFIPDLPAPKLDAMRNWSRRWKRPCQSTRPCLMRSTGCPLE